MAEADQIILACAGKRGCLHLPTSAPFDIDVSLNGTWATLECNVHEYVDPHGAQRLDAIVRSWIEWVNNSESAHASGESIYAAHASKAIVGEDFVQWSLQIHLKELQKLNVLISGLLELHKRGVNIESIYIG